MKTALFIYIDNTLLVKYKGDKMIESLERPEYYPGVFSNLSRIALELDYELILLSNQINNQLPDKFFKTFEAEGVKFANSLTINDFQPNNAILQTYKEGEYDFSNSYIIANSLADLQLATTIKTKVIFLGSLDKSQSKDISKNIEFYADSWSDIYKFLKHPDRISTVKRITSETSISVTVNLDGSGQSNISTGLNFFDHILDQIGRHGLIDLTIKVSGDLHVDEHHTIEDTAIVLGEAILKALGNKRGIERYGFCLPMDDCLCQVALDFGGRPWLVWDADFKREKIGDMPTEMFLHFFKSFSDASRSNLNIKAEGTNEHHKIEGIFKAYAKAIKMAVKRDINNNALPSTKGRL